MTKTLWDKTEWDDDPEVHCWELYHESAKTGRYDKAMSNEAIVEIMSNLHESFPYRNKKTIPLPEKRSPISKGFEQVVLERVTAKNISPVNISAEDLGTILHFAYGQTRDNADGTYTRPFRTVPSGGALYPLELYFFSNGYIDGLQAGLYHYSSSLNAVHLIREGDFREEISAGLVSFQSNLAYDLSLVIFITAVFQRSVFKYREKGYRFAILEAGHVSQNINLTATALDLGVINIGGYHDREIDQFLGIDGLNQSTIYMTGICSGSK